MMKKLFPLWLMLGLFTTPFLLAHLIYINKHHLQFKTYQQGNLVTPPIRSSLLSIEKLRVLDESKYTKNNSPPKWQLIYFTPEHCANNIDGFHYSSDSIHASSMHACQQRKHELSNLQQALGKASNKVDILLAAHGHHHMTTANNLIILDPNEQVIMHYAATTSSSAILKDLRQLLRNTNAR